MGTRHSPHRRTGAGAYLKVIEDGELSDSFWDVTLPANLDTSSVRSPYFQTFLAAQVHLGARGFLSKSIKVQTMKEQSGDIHHIVPKDYLRKNGYPDRGDYNQVANFVLTETPINIKIGNRPPADYMGLLEGQLSGGPLHLGEITEQGDLRRNLAENAVPDDLDMVTAAGYQEFLARRRRLMAGLMRDYFRSL